MGQIYNFELCSAFSRRMPIQGTECREKRIHLGGKFLQAQIFIWLFSPKLDGQFLHN
jgi:hypothetical protein